MQMLGQITAGVSGAGAAMQSPDALSALRMGTTALSAVSSYGLASSQADQLSNEADLTKLSANQEYVQAAQQSNNLMREYQQVTGKQLVTAAAEGVDVSSGSVQAQQSYASSNVMRQINEVRSGANMNASLRLARAYALSQAASQTRIMGGIGAASKVMSGFLQNAQIGGPSGSGAAPGSGGSPSPD